jgi:hypothetical protein
MVLSTLSSNVWLWDIVGPLTLPILVQYVQVRELIEAIQLNPMEYDDDITNMDTPTIVDYDSKVKLFLASLYLIHVMNGRCTMIHV